MAAKFDYYTVHETEQFTFVRIPKVFFTNDLFKNLSLDSKVLYGFMLDRMSLSIANGWIDDERHPYIIFSIEAIMESMCCAKQKAVKILSELDEAKGIGLIKKVKRGFGKPDLIYVKNFARVLDENGSFKTLSEPKKQEVKDSDSSWYENHTSRGMKIKPTEVCYSNPNNTEYFSNTENINNLSIKCEEFAEENDTEQAYDLQENERKEFNSILSLLQENKNQNISYKQLYKFTKNLISADELVSHLSDGYNDRVTKGQVEEIIQLLIDVFSASASTIYVAGANRNIDVVRNRFLKLDYNLVLQVCNNVRNNKTRVKNPCQYLLSMFYNANSSQGYNGTSLIYPEVNL